MDNTNEECFDDEQNSYNVIDVLIFGWRSNINLDTYEISFKTIHNHRKNFDGTLKIHWRVSEELMYD